MAERPGKFDSRFQIRISGGERQEDGTYRIFSPEEAYKSIRGQYLDLERLFYLCHNGTVKPQELVLRLDPEDPMHDLAQRVQMTRTLISWAFQEPTLRSGGYSSVAPIREPVDLNFEGVTEKN